jgi:CubicO group peptidase (beta-lactamase class C family)
VQVISDPIAAAMRVGPGSFGWDGAFGTHFWADPKEQIVGLLMVQTSNRDTDRDSSAVRSRQRDDAMRRQFRQATSCLYGR